jgi:hypothetical protein
MLTSIGGTGEEARPVTVTPLWEVHNDDGR